MLRSAVRELTTIAAGFGVGAVLSAAVALAEGVSGEDSLAIGLGFLWFFVLIVFLTRRDFAPAEWTRAPVAPRDLAVAERPNLLPIGVLLVVAGLVIAVDVESAAYIAGAFAAAGLTTALGARRARAWEQSSGEALLTTSSLVRGGTFLRRPAGA